MRSCFNEATTMPNSLENDVIKAAKVGFDGIELWWEKIEKYLQKHSADDLKDLLIKNKIVPVSICPLRIWPFRNSEPARKEFSRAVDVSSKIGCDLVIVCPDFQPASLTREEAMRVHATELKDMAKYAHNFGIRLAIEPIGMHTLVPGPMQALELIKLAGNPSNVGLLMDTFHYFRSQITDKEIETIPVEKLYIVHVNDSEDGPINELSDANRLYPGLGVLPLEKYFNLLSKLKYQGFVSVEIFRPEYWNEAYDEVIEKSYSQLMKYI